MDDSSSGSHSHSNSINNNNHQHGMDQQQSLNNNHNENNNNNHYLSNNNYSNNNNNNNNNMGNNSNGNGDSPKVRRRRSASDVAQNNDLKRAFRIYWASDDHMYWTFLLDSTNTVGDITDGLKTKVPTGVQVYLYKRTKGNFGRWKDRRLSNEDKVWDIVDKRRDKSKSDPIFVVKKKKSSLNLSKKITSIDSSSPSHNSTSSAAAASAVAAALTSTASGGSSSSTDSTLSPLSNSGEILNNNHAINHISSSQSTSSNNLYSNHHANINSNHNNNNNNNNNNSSGGSSNSSTPPTPYLNTSPVPIRIVNSNSTSNSNIIPTSNTSQQQSQPQQQSNATGNGLKTTMEINPPSTSSPSQQQQQQQPKSVKISTINNGHVNNNNNNNNNLSSSSSSSSSSNSNSNSTPPTITINSQPPPQSSIVQRPSSPNPSSSSNSTNSPFKKVSNNKNNNRLTSQDPNKEIMRLMRFYFSEMSSFGGQEGGGRFFTIAVHKETTARDVGISIEQKLALPEASITVNLVLPVQSNGSKIERMLGDDESIIDVKDSWEDPSQTFFLVKESTIYRQLQQQFNHLFTNQPIPIPSSQQQQQPQQPQQQSSSPPPPLPPQTNTTSTSNKRSSKSLLPGVLTAAGNGVYSGNGHEPIVIPSEWRRSTDAISLRSSEDLWKRKSIPIFLQVSPASPHKSVGISSPLANMVASANQGIQNVTDDEGDDSDEESELDLTLLKGWVHWIPSVELEYIKRIGSGTYSKVYKGKYRDKFVAIKTMRGTNMTTEQIQAFKKECDILSTIQSPYLISFYGSCVEESQLSMVVEYCGKGTMHKVLNSPNLDFDWEKWFKWTIQVAEGVKYLHNMNPPMVHRDLKTLNILIASDWNAKLCDFGLTRTMTMTNVSTLGMLRGTMAYTAPEIYDGLLFNTKSDVYSLGVIMWELVQRCLSGTYLRPFYDHPISMDIQIIILTSKNKVRPTIPQSCPPELAKLIVKCWDQDPEARPSSDELLHQLNQLKLNFESNRNSWESLRTKNEKLIKKEQLIQQQQIQLQQQLQQQFKSQNQDNNSNNPQSQSSSSSSNFVNNNNNNTSQLDQQMINNNNNNNLNTNTTTTTTTITTNSTNNNDIQDGGIVDRAGEDAIKNVLKNNCNNNNNNNNNNNLSQITHQPSL